MTDLKKLRNVKCACCKKDQKLVPDEFPEAMLQALSDQASKGAGNMTLCQFCAFPMRFDPEVNEWIQLESQLLVKLPVSAIKSCISAMKEIVEQNHDWQNQNSVLLMEFLVAMKEATPGNHDLSGVVVEHDMEKFKITPQTSETQKTDHSNN